MVLAIKNLVLVGAGLFVLFMFILPFGYFFATGEFPKGYPIQISAEKAGETAATKYVCQDGNVVASPELCPEGEALPAAGQPTTEQPAAGQPAGSAVADSNQALIKGDIELELGIVQEDVKGYLASWYNEFYPVLESTAGKPCKPFKANVIYSPTGSGGSFQAAGLGETANILFNMPLDRSGAYDAGFDSRFAHEFSHGFMNGIRSIAERTVTVSFVDEGFAESVTQIALLEEIKKGREDYRYLGHYLPYHIASYDAYTIQGRGAAGGTQMWKGDSVGWYYKQGEVVWYLMEQAKPGAIKEFLKKACALQQTQEQQSSVIYMTYEQYKNILEGIFGGTKIEGMSVLEWFDSQPVTNINGETGTYMRIMFSNQGKIYTAGKPANPVGRSINPGIINISAVRRVIDSREGPKDEALETNPTIKIFNWKGELVSETASVFIPALPAGAYKVEASDSVLNAKATTYFVVTSTVGEDSLYGIKLENREIVSSGVVKSSLGDAAISNGFFVVKVLSGTKEVTFPDAGRTVIKPFQMARMVILT